MFNQKSKGTDLTTGSITKHLICFAVPLLLGNIFQMLYNTVDVLVVGNFVGKEALAAVGATGSIINMQVMFFNGVSIGAGVIISQCYGAQDDHALHDAIETTMALTIIISILFTFLGVWGVDYLLVFMATPEDVFASASTYLKIYFSGISGLLIYNMGSGILRAVGDTKRPLLFLIFTSFLNMILDLIFVVMFKMGIAGVGYATILAQFISAILVILVLIRTDQNYRLVLRDLRIHGKLMLQILSVGLPTGLQSMLTQFSNVFAQSYVNYFGSSCMAGWSCFNKLDQLVFLPINSMGQSATTFVSQNCGAGRMDRVKQGTREAIYLSTFATLLFSAALYVLAHPLTVMFTRDASVISYSVMFIHMTLWFREFNCINHILAASIRGRKDSRGPMIIMVASLVVCRQIYLFLITKVVNTPFSVGMGWPFGWVLCCCLMAGYYYWNYMRKGSENDTMPVGTASRKTQRTRIDYQHEQMYNIKVKKDNHSPG